MTNFPPSFNENSGLLHFAHTVVADISSMPLSRLGVGVLVMVLVGVPVVLDLVLRVDWGVWLGVFN